MGVQSNQKGFTIVELLVVIVVIGILAAIVTVAYGGIQAKARDSRRLSDMQTIASELELYKAQNSMYTNSSNNGPGGWESSSISPSQFLQSLKLGGLVSSIPVDPVNTSSMEYRYYRYPAGSSGCDSSRGAFFVLGILDMESSTGPSPKSPGWSCPSRNWQSEFEWVTGSFEN
jgi:general secretion pathway protein G